VPTIEAHVTCFVNDGKSLAMLPDESVDFIFSYDSLVHAEADAVGSLAGAGWRWPARAVACRKPPERSCRMRILVIEDSPLVQNMYRLAFPRRAYDLVTAGDGREALQRLQESAFDVVLLDLRMPGMNGVEFLREARRRPELARLPVVLTTIEAEGSELLEAAKRLGVAAVVKKPWHPQQLRTLVDGICGQRPGDGVGG
jgi:CheY-like chemotaxis protein